MVYPQRDELYLGKEEVGAENRSEHEREARGSQWEFDDLMRLEGHKHEVIILLVPHYFT